MLIRKEIIPIDEVYSAVKDVLFEPNRKKSFVNIRGDLIKGNSQRFQTFFTKGLKCVSCGIEGKYFAKEKTKGDKRYHLNLYAIDGNGKEVLMTKDHIFPHNKGGKNNISNYQTMCVKCNVAKGSRILQEETIMSFVVKGSFGEIEVDCIINGLITPNKMIMFNAMLVDGRKIFVGIAPINKVIKKHQSRFKKSIRYLKGQNCKKEKQHQPINLSTNGETGKEVYTYFMDPFSRREKLLVYNVRTNGKRVQVEFDGVKAMASCNIEAGDQFDYKFGRELAERRLIAKLIEKRANSYYISKISKTN